MRLWDHVVHVLPLEYIGIGQVEGFCDDDAAITPVKAVSACRESDFTLLSFGIDGFEEHIPGVVFPNHEGVSNDLSLNIGHITRVKNWIGNTLGWCPSEWIFGLINSNRT